MIELLTDFFGLRADGKEVELMEEAIALIDKLVEEHKLIRQRIGNIESVANDPS